MDIDEKVTTWKELHEIAEKFEDTSSDWVFRGQKPLSDKWSLKTSIESVAERYQIPLVELPELEQGLIREFKRHFHHYRPYHPDDDDWMEWLSIMQHYGAPTRLLDVTYSFFVAFFFAIARANKSKENSIELWAFNAQIMEEAYNVKYHYDPKPKDIEKHDHNDYKKYNAAILSQRFASVRTINSFNQNERQRIQQGLFLIPIDVTKPFMENLEETEKLSGPGTVRRIEIACTSDLFEQALPALRRMNITSSSLFPDLIGFSESLQMRMFNPESLFSGRNGFPGPAFP